MLGDFATKIKYLIKYQVIGAAQSMLMMEDAYLIAEVTGEGRLTKCSVLTVM